MVFMAAKRGGGNFGSIESGVLNGPDQLWLAWNGEKILAAAVTSLGLINNEKICTIVACGGDEWSRFGHLIEGLEKFAKAEGCKRTRINGRRGWLRALKGYRETQVTMMKEIYIMVE
jgi:hypothetical protein